MEPHLRHLLEELNAARGRSPEDEGDELTRLHEAVTDRLAGASPDEHQGLVDSLQDAERRFEADHPSLAQAIRQALHSLSSTGI